MLALLELLIVRIYKIHVLDIMIYTLLSVQVLVLLSVLLIIKWIDNWIHDVKALKSWQILLIDSIGNLHN